MRSSSNNRPQMFYAQRRNTNVTPGCFLKRHFEKCRGDLISPLPQQVLVYIFYTPNPPPDCNLRAALGERLG